MTDEKMDEMPMVVNESISDDSSLRDCEGKPIWTPKPRSKIRAGRKYDTDEDLYARCKGRYLVNQKIARGEPVFDIFNPPHVLEAQRLANEEKAREYAALDELQKRCVAAEEKRRRRMELERKYWPRPQFNPARDIAPPISFAHIKLRANRQKEWLSDEDEGVQIENESPEIENESPEIENESPEIENEESPEIENDSKTSPNQGQGAKFAKPCTPAFASISAAKPPSTATEQDSNERGEEKKRKKFVDTPRPHKPARSSVQQEQQLEKVVVEQQDGQVGPDGAVVGQQDGQVEAESVISEKQVELDGAVVEQQVEAESVIVEKQGEPESAVVEQQVQPEQQRPVLPLQQSTPIAPSASTWNRTPITLINNVTVIEHAPSRSGTARRPRARIGRKKSTTVGEQQHQETDQEIDQCQMGDIRAMQKDFTEDLGRAGPSPTDASASKHQRLEGSSPNSERSAVAESDFDEDDRESEIGSRDDSIAKDEKEDAQVKLVNYSYSLSQQIPAVQLPPDDAKKETSLLQQIEDGAVDISKCRISTNTQQNSSTDNTTFDPKKEDEIADEKDVTMESIPETATSRHDSLPDKTITKSADVVSAPSQDNREESGQENVCSGLITSENVQISNVASMRTVLVNYSSSFSQQVAGVQSPFEDAKKEKSVLREIEDGAVQVSNRPISTGTTQYNSLTRSITPLSFDSAKEDEIDDEKTISMESIPETTASRHSSAPEVSAASSDHQEDEEEEEDECGQEDILSDNSEIAANSGNVSGENNNNNNNNTNLNAFNSFIYTTDICKDSPVSGFVDRSSDGFDSQDTTMFSSSSSAGPSASFVARRPSLFAEPLLHVNKVSKGEGTESPTVVLLNPKIESPEGTPGLRRSNRHRVPRLAGYMNQRIQYKRLENGTEEAVGVQEVRVTDRHMKRFRTVDPGKLLEEQQRHQRLAKKRRQDKEARNPKAMRIKAKRAELKRLHNAGFNLTQSSRDLSHSE